MPLNVTLEISDRELEQFRSVLAGVRERTAGKTPHEVAAAARAAVEKLRAGTPSPFVATRLHKVHALADMLEDPEWQLPGPERRRVLDGLAYVADVHDLVPDNIPVLGLVDDAIMLELVLRELQHELDGYHDFHEFRQHELARPGAAAHPSASRENWLDSKRRALHDRIRDRRERELEQSGGDFPLITHF
jgi:uncharacterized membrane protein YkvA (DUF1232 family)